MKNIYVGNLPHSVVEAELETLFRECGEVSRVRIIKDRITGNSSGFGFVEMPSDAEAQAAINKFNGYELKGRPLRVNEARPREERPRNDRGPRGGGYSSDRGGFGGRRDNGGFGGNRY